MLRKKLRMEPPELSKGATLADRLLTIESDLADQLDGIDFESSDTMTSSSKLSITHTYNPLKYARDARSIFFRKYCGEEATSTKTRPLLFCGMNPGPNGMVQTGLPFGDVETVRRWFDIDRYRVDRSSIAKESPRRPVRDGLDEIGVTEVSGKRFWGYFKRLCCTADRFFANCYVHNYCPLAFFSGDGSNVTPNRLKAKSCARLELESFCDRHLIDVCRLFGVETIVALGRYTERRCRAALKTAGLPVRVRYLIHPSPIACTEEHWCEEIDRLLKETDLMRHFAHEGEQEQVQKCTGAK